MYKSPFVHSIKENEGIIYKIVKIYADTIEDQKDLYQEIVYQLWKSYGSFKGDSKISTWIYRIALNTSLAQLKKQKNHKNQVVFDPAFLNGIDQMESLMEERIDRLYKTIKQLNVVERGVILLYLESKSHEEIADITGFTISNVGTRISRIKQKLKSKLN